MLASIFITLEQEVRFPVIHRNDNLLETGIFLEEQYNCGPTTDAKFNGQSPAWDLWLDEKQLTDKNSFPEKGREE